MFFLLQKNIFLKNKVLPSQNKLISIDEREERDAQELFYSRVMAEMSEKKKKRLNFLQKVTIVYSPGFVMAFMTVYWLAGLKHAEMI